MENKSSRLRSSWNVLKETFELYSKHDIPTLGAALSYYTVFSIAPLLIIIISAVGMIFGPKAIAGDVSREMQETLGPESAQLLENIIKAAYKPGYHLSITIVATIFLLTSAATVFMQLRKSLNVIWEIQPHMQEAVVQFFVSRLFSFAMIGALIFLLLVSLLVHAGLSSFDHYLKLQGTSVVLLHGINHFAAFLLTMLMFSLTFKVMSDAKLTWSSIWEGATFTAILFTLGKYAIGMYLGSRHLGTTFGAAASIVLLLAWVFYSSQIFFFGAGFTLALATERGIRLHPGLSSKEETDL